jgi:MoaA/NifB/PqqE/SkfB family radical SAM enzyme
MVKKKELNKLEKILAVILAVNQNKYLRKFPLRLRIRVFKDFTKTKIIKIGGKYFTLVFMPPYPSKAFDRLMKAFLNHKNSLTNVHLSVTNKCFFNCEYCSNKYKKGREMALEEIKKIIRKLQEKELPQIWFTGGEPLLRKDFPEIVKHVGDKSASYVFTSGYGLDEKKAMELKKAGLTGIVVSLDSHNPEVNDKLRGRKGAFETAVKAIEISKKTGFYTMAQMVVKKETIHELEKNLKFFKSLGVDNVLVLEVFPCGRFIRKRDVMLNSEQRKKLKEIQFLADKRKDFPKVSSYNYFESEDFIGCVGGYNLLYIDAQGEVCVCDMTPISFGNIVKEDFEIIWKRLRKTFQKPSGQCFMQQHSKEIAKKFKGKLPINYKQTLEICKNHCPKGIGEYYRLLGK